LDKISRTNSWKIEHLLRALPGVVETNVAQSDFVNDYRAKTLPGRL